MIFRWMPQTKSVFPKSRKDMKVRVKDLLSGRHTVSQEKIDTFASNAAVANGRG